MGCSQCGNDNPPDARFCEQCGAGLEALCPACGSAVSQDAKFCGKCGGTLSAPATPKEAEGAPAAPESSAPDSSAPAGERRQATVLFSDLSGYTAMNEKLDPEEVAGIMGRLKTEAVEIVEEHGGIVNQFVGDEVLALFGIPTAHKDDPRRAVRAALELHKLARRISPEVEDKIGRPLSLHTGINTGLIVTNLRDARDGTYGITGDTVNTGARLKTLAEDDQILLSPETQRQIAAYFETTPLEAVELKGKEGRMTPFRVAGELRGQREGQQAFVGRQAELRQFAGIVQACLEEGRGQAVYLRGEAGIGKTRLVEELRDIAEGKGFSCHTGLILDFGIGKGRDAVRAIVRSLLGIAPGSGKDVRRAAAGQAIADGVLSAEREPFLNDLLDYRQPAEWRGIYDAMDNETRNRGKRETVVELVRAASSSAPLLVVIEDLHWADGIALDHLASLASMAGETPVVLLMTSRIEGDPLDAAWRGKTGGSPLLTLDLAPLRKNEALELAGGFMDATSRFAANCIARAEGNPLFLEQLLRSAEETEEDAVPGSVQSIVLARMDRLDAPDKQALQAASTLGQHFGLEVLRHLLDDTGYSCTGLIAHYLVRPEGGDYLFCHALIQEGIYNSLLKARRRELHQKAAEWFKGRDAVLRAEHLDRAEDPAAPQAYLEAAQTQAGEFHYERAVRMAGRGLELAAEQPEQFALTCFQGQMHHDLGAIPESVAAYEKAQEFAADDAQRCRAWIGIAAGMRITGNSDAALENLDKAETAAKANSLTLELAQLHHLRGNIYYPMGILDGCLEQHELALAKAREAGSGEYEARALGGLADASYVQGRMRTANDQTKRCVELCRERGFARIEAAYLPMVGVTRMYLNDFNGAVETCLTGATAAKQMGQLRPEMVARQVAGYSLIALGNLADASEQLDESLALARRLEARRNQPVTLVSLAKIAAQQGRLGHAMELVEEAMEINREIGNQYSGALVFGALTLLTEDPEHRKDALNEGEAILREGGVSLSYLWFYRDAMQSCLNTAAWDEVERYATALEEYTRPEPLPWSDFYISRGRALAAHGRGERGEALIQKLKGLREEAERVGLKAALPEIEEALDA